jgi:hypothetical protein
MSDAGSIAADACTRRRERPTLAAVSGSRSFWAVGACVAYVAAATIGRGAIPFTAFPMFAFPVLQPPLAVPYFAVDGDRAEVTDYDAFWDLGPEDVDVAHRGYASTAEHMFYDLQRWIQDHPGTENRTNARPCAVGITIVTIGPSGEIALEDRVDAEGSCRPR